MSPARHMTKGMMSAGATFTEMRGTETVSWVRDRVCSELVLCDVSGYISLMTSRFVFVHGITYGDLIALQLFVIVVIEKSVTIRTEFYLFSAQRIGFSFEMIGKSQVIGFELQYLIICRLEMLSNFWFFSSD